LIVFLQDAFGETAGKQEARQPENFTREILKNARKYRVASKKSAPPKPVSCVDYRMFFQKWHSVFANISRGTNHRENPKVRT
jgi:hypothetical protein